MSVAELLAAQIARFALPIVEEALLASFVAALLLAITTTPRLREMSFTSRFLYVLWRYALPACVLTSAVYWLLFAALSR